jgi:hypothetical protein
MELTVLVAATVLMSRALQEVAAVVAQRLHQSCAAVVAQQAAVAAELPAVAAVVEPAEKCLMYLEPSLLDQWLDRCCAAMQPWPDSSR